LPLNQAMRELVGCVMVVTAILAVPINRPWAMSARPDLRAGCEEYMPRGKLNNTPL
jgi:hypothetical protein